MITGSHHQQIYWYATGQHRLLGQLPGAYLIRRAALDSAARWRCCIRRAIRCSPRPATGTASASPATPRTASRDSSTPFGSQPIASQVVDSTTVEHGIACESCHGPARDARRRQSQPAAPLRLAPDAAAPTRPSCSRRGWIPQKSSQVCGQCHGIWEFYDGAGERHANTAGPAVPPRRRSGGHAVRRAADAQWRFADDAGAPRRRHRLRPRLVLVRRHGARVGPRIQRPHRVALFRQGARTPARTLSCSSCHYAAQEAGRSAADERSGRTISWAAGMDGNEACTQCHRPIAANVARTPVMPSGSTGSACYNCHMPYTTYGLLKTIRSHTIGSPSVAETAEGGPAERLQPVPSGQDAAVDLGRARSAGTGSRRRR